MYSTAVIVTASFFLGKNQYPPRCRYAAPTQRAIFAILTRPDTHHVNFKALIWRRTSEPIEIHAMCVRMFQNESVTATKPHWGRAAKRLRGVAREEARTESDDSDYIPYKK